MEALLLALILVILVAIGGVVDRIEKIMRDK
jgi:hypothetical protein